MVKQSSFDNTTIKGLILDMDGVLWRNTTPIGNLAWIFKTIEELGLRVVMATNNPTRSPVQYVEKLQGFGVSIQPWQVLNSGMATALYLKERFPVGSDIFVVGEDALIETLENEGFNPNGDHPVAVVAAMDRGINYDKLTRATLLIRAGVPFIGTNPDRSFPIPEGLAPGAGAILAALEASSDVTPTIIGKPQPAMYKAALIRLRIAPEETLVVGDRLETDILGAQNTGCPSALVLSGVTTLEAAQQWKPTPDIIADDLTSVITSLIPD